MIVRRLFNLLAYPPLEPNEHVTMRDVLALAAVQFGYWARPFDTKLDSRRWRWQSNECRPVLVGPSDVLADDCGNIDMRATALRAAARDLSYRHQVLQARASFVPWWRAWQRCRAVRYRAPYRPTAWSPAKPLRCHLRYGHDDPQHAMPDGYDVRFFA